MPSVDFYDVIFKKGSGIPTARIVTPEGELLTQDDVSAVEYSIYHLNRVNPDSRVAVEGHEGILLEVANVIYNDLLEGYYNFAHEIDITTYTAFPNVGLYLLEYTITPVTGQKILIRWRLDAI